MRQRSSSVISIDFVVWIRSVSPSRHGLAIASAVVVCRCLVMFIGGRFWVELLRSVSLWVCFVFVAFVFHGDEIATVWVRSCAAADRWGIVAVVGFYRVEGGPDAMQSGRISRRAQNH